MQKYVTEIIPGVLEQDWESTKVKIEKVLPFAKSLHIDLLDGKFAPNTSFADPTPFAAYKDNLTLELHMMVDDPLSFVEPWAKAGVTRFIGQIEMMPDQNEFVAKAKQYGEAGLAVDSETPHDAITVSFDELDFLFAMTVKAGFSNQSFLPENLAKVREWRKKTSIPIEVDGGINDETLKLALDSGATRFVSTGFLFNKGEPKSQFDKLRAVCQAVHHS